MTTRRLIRLPEVMNKTGYSKAWIYLLCKINPTTHAIPYLPSG